MTATVHTQGVPRDPFSTSEYRPPRDPYNPFDERALGLGMMGVIFFCAVTGLGLGVFLEQPAAGGLVGGALGIVVGLWVIPALMRDWHD